MLKFISTCNIKVIYEFMTAALNLIHYDQRWWWTDDQAMVIH